MINSCNSFAAQTLNLRKKIGYTMQELADRASVSKSTICKIERGDVQPTLDVAARIALALGTNLSTMLHAKTSTEVIHLPKDKQPVWEDPKSHLVRRVISPVFLHSNFEWLQIKLAPNSSTGRLPAQNKGSEKCIHVLKGKIKVKVGLQEYSLDTGDSLYFEATASHENINPYDEEAQCFVITKAA